MERGILGVGKTLKKDRCYRCRAGLLSVFLLLELEGIYDKNNISALKCSEVLPDFPLSSHTVCAPKSLQEKMLGAGLRS